VRILHEGIRPSHSSVQEGLVEFYLPPARLVEHRAHDLLYPYRHLSQPLRLCSKTLAYRSFVPVPIGTDYP
jgi:hypothetical protein